MTTIVADAKAGVMVADSKLVVDPVWFPCKKVLRCGSELIGTAGSDKNSSIWLGWYLSGKVGKAPKMDEDAGFEALILRQSGLFHVGVDIHEVRVPRGFLAIGSGGPAATAVMLVKRDARLAAHIACQVDNNSGGRLQIERLRVKKGR